MNTEENNKLIAEFMGMDYGILTNQKGFFTKNNYEYSWDWLMPVVKKIRSNKLFPKSFTVIINDDDIIKAPCNSDHLLIEGLYTQNIELVHNGVIEFIKWYNKKHK